MKLINEKQFFLRRILNLIYDNANKTLCVLFTVVKNIFIRFINNFKNIVQGNVINHSKINCKKINIIMHAFCDEDNYNAQNMNAKEIAIRLNNNRYNVSLFYVLKPDEKVLDKENIHLIKIPSYKDKPIKILSSVFLLYHFLKPYDIIFYVRPFKLDKIYLKIKTILRDKKISVSTVEGVIGDHSRMIAKENILKSDYVYSVSKYVSETVLTHYKIKTPIIYVGVDPNIFKHKPNRFKERKNNVRVLFVGTLSERKRPHLIIKAAEKFPNVEFHLIGDGPLKSVLIKSILDSKTKNVFMHGKVDTETLVFHLQIADIFLLPSIIEGFPKVTLEAAATGTPSIVFENYKPETVVNGETGFIVRTYDEMINKLTLLINNEPLRQRLGRRAREHAQKFHWDNIVKQWEEEFEKMIMRDV